VISSPPFFGWPAVLRIEGIAMEVPKIIDKLFVVISMR
jgi:hypothetical protein